MRQPIQSYTPDQTSGKPYRIEREWQDGESMQAHVIAEFDNPAHALAYVRLHGGTLVRIEDGALWVGGEWIDAITGTIIVSPSDDGRSSK